MGFSLAWALALTASQNLAFAGEIFPCSVPADETSTKFCLPEKDRIPFSHRNSFFFGRDSRVGTRTLRLEIRSWGAHRVTTRLAEILLREHVGLDVVVQSFSRADGCDGSPGAHAYERLANGTADINFELWPANFMTDRSQALRSATYMGKLDYAGRSGWFVPVASLQNAYPQHWATLHPNGTVAEAHAQGLDPWRGFFPLFDFNHLYSQLMRADQLAQPESSCSTQGNSVQPAHGAYNCEEGTWYPTDGRCCPRGHTCTSSVMPCRALYVQSPTYDSGRNEEAIHLSGLPLQILYGDGLTAAVVQAEEV